MERATDHRQTSLPLYRPIKMGPLFTSPKNWAPSVIFGPVSPVTTLSIRNDYSCPTGQEHAAQTRFVPNPGVGRMLADPLVVRPRRCG